VLARQIERVDVLAPDPVGFAAMLWDGHSRDFHLAKDKPLAL
jgi:hypothetical protein